ncbi:MAG: RnfABCDGE type electron transport complex subunit G [candidate division KSB1 bacterium]|nr:RnfABCDGE type electron transport complex subunit G [candidate division KSB1 bacterium]
MNYIVKLAAILTVVTSVSGAALSLVNRITKPRIEQQQRLVTERALTEALPQANKEAIIPVKTGDQVLYYKGFASADTTQLVGYAFLAVGKGYSSDIITMVGVDTNGIIQGIKIISQIETPGLGSKIEEIRYGEETSWFQKQFIGRSGKELAVDKDGGTIISVTGATISSRAVTNSIKKALAELEQKVSEFK